MPEDSHRNRTGIRSTHVYIVYRYRRSNHAYSARFTTPNQNMHSLTTTHIQVRFNEQFAALRRPEVVTVVDAIDELIAERQHALLGTLATQIRQ